MYDYFFEYYRSYLKVSCNLTINLKLYTDGTLKRRSFIDFLVLCLRKTNTFIKHQFLNNKTFFLFYYNFINCFPIGLKYSPIVNFNTI